MRFFRIFITVLLVLLIGGFSAYALLQYSYQHYLATPVDKNSSARILFTIAPGETGKKISEKLSDLDIIPSQWAFYWYIKSNAIAPQLEAGKFVLKKSYTIPEIAEALTHGKNEEIIVTIREGLTVEQVDEYFAQNSIFPQGSFLECAKNCVIEQRFSFLDSKPKAQSLEGYLFADTYFVDPETVTPKELVIKMLRNFDSKLSSELRSEIAKTGYSIHQIATMASLIEKEAQTKEEKPIISGILWKRFREKIVLGVDATVRYALNKWTGPLTIDDLNVESSYNTRKKGGLPPGPIGNFSLNSLIAAIMPKESDYYYYLHDDQGIIHYAKTNEEHAANKRKYFMNN